MTQPISSALRGFLAGEPPAPTDAEVIAGRLMRPERAHEETVRSVIARLPLAASGAELWEALSAEGIVPPSWFHDPRRLFIDKSVTTFPSWEQAAALAADPAGVEAAEELARECCARLALFAPRRHDLHRAADGRVVAWGVRAPTAVLQLPDSNLLPFAGDLVISVLLRSPLRAEMQVRGAEAWRAMTRAISETYGGPDAAGLVLGPILPHNATSIVTLFAQFEAVRAAGSRLTLARRLRGTQLASVHVSNFPNPWEPLVGLYKMGYVFAGFMDGAGWAPILLCPPLGPCERGRYQ